MCSSDLTVNLVAKLARGSADRCTGRQIVGAGIENFAPHRNIENDSECDVIIDLIGGNNL